MTTRFIKGAVLIRSGFLPRKIQKYSQKLQVDIHAYVLMANVKC
jgi:hypothetical protein